MEYLKKCFWFNIIQFQEVTWNLLQNECPLKIKRLIFLGFFVVRSYFVEDFVEDSDVNIESSSCDYVLIDLQ